MEALGKQALRLFAIYLVMSLELGQIVLQREAYGQSPEQLGDFLRKLEGYLGDATPSESVPIEESEYVVPKGFDNSIAEWIWKALAPYVSMGFTQEQLRSISSKLLNQTGPTFAVRLSDGSEVELNFSALQITMGSDGSVSLRIPIASNASLDYLRYNSTNIRTFYDVWNQTLIRYYRVRHFTSSFNTTYRDLTTGKEFSIVSKLSVQALTPPEDIESGKWDYIIRGIEGSKPIAVPGHYEYFRVLMPGHNRRFRVLFPSYDPVFFTGWIVDTNISQSSLTIGQVLEVGFGAVPEGIDPASEPLNATIQVVSPDSFQVIGANSSALTNTNRSGIFRLRAIGPGTYNITLRIEGNAYFRVWPVSQELQYVIQVVAPSSPSIDVSITSVDTSVLKHANVTVEVRNNGGSSARNVLLEISGDLEGESRSLGDIGVGESRTESFLVKLAAQQANIFLRAIYYDSFNNRYVSEARTSVFSSNYVVPEHFEEYVGTVPEHEELRKVFVPGYEGYTHIRFYAVYNKVGWKEGMQIGGPFMVLAAEGPGIVVSTTLVPCAVPAPEIEITAEVSSPVLKESGVQYMVTKIEPCWEDLGEIEEKKATEIVGVSAEQLRNGELPDQYQSEFVASCWVNASGSIALSPDQFEQFKVRMEDYQALNPLMAEDFRYQCRKYVVANRTFEESIDEGYAIFLYHPLKVRGSGPLRSIQVKNYATRDNRYELKVVESIGSAPPLYDVEPTNGTTLDVNGLATQQILASSISGESFWIRIQLRLCAAVIAETFFDMRPELSPYWRGFWDSFGPRSKGVIFSSGLMVLLSITTGPIHSGLTIGAFFLHYLLGTGANIGELWQAWEASNFFGGMSNRFRVMGAEFQSKNLTKSASVLFGLSNDFEMAKAKLWVNTGLDLIADVNLTDAEIVAGLRSADEYQKGVAAGRIAGTILSIATYTAVFMKIQKLQGISGTGKSPISLVRQAFWNWLTPSLYDLCNLALQKKLAIGNRLANIVFWKKVSDDYSEFTAKKASWTVQELEEESDLFEKTMELCETARWEDTVLNVLSVMARLRDAGESGKGIGDFLSDLKDLSKKDVEFHRDFVDWLRLGKDGAVLKEVAEDIVHGLNGVDESELGQFELALKKIGGEFDNGFGLFKSYFSIESNYVKHGSRAIGKVKEAFLRRVGIDGVEALDAWVKAIENGQLAARAKTSKTTVVLLLPTGLVEAFRLKAEDVLTVIIDKDGEEFRALTTLEEDDIDYYRTSLRRATLNNLGLKGGDYARISFGIDEPSLFTRTDMQSGESAAYKMVDSLDSLYLEQVKGGEGFYVVRYRRIGDLDEDGNLQLTYDAKDNFLVRDVREQEKLTFVSDGPGVYKVDLLQKIGNIEIDEVLRSLPVGSNIQFNTENGKFTIKGTTLESGSFEFERGIRADDTHHGGIQSVLLLNPSEEVKRALVIRIVTDPETGDLIGRTDFAYEFGQEKWYPVSEIETTTEDGNLVLRIRHERAWEGPPVNTYMEWTGSEFIDARFPPNSRFFDEIMGQFTEVLGHLEASLLDKEGRRMIVEFGSYKEQFGEPLDEAGWHFTSNAKGVASTEFIRVLLLEKFRELFGIGEGYDMEIDQSGDNSGENWFDIFVKDKIGGKVVFAGEAESAWTEEWDPNKLLVGAIVDLKNHKDKVTSADWNLPQFGYAFAIHITSDMIEIRWIEYEFP